MQNTIRIETLQKHQWKKFLCLQSLLIDGKISLKASHLKQLGNIYFREIRVHHPPHYVWVAHLKGKYVGHLWGCILPIQLTQDKRKLNLFNIVVEPLFRRCGIGSALYIHAEKFCREREIGVIDCQTKLSDGDATHFCCKNGYRVDGLMFRRNLP